MLLALAARGPREVESARDRHRDDMGLICPPCHQIHCTTWNPADLRCEGGVTTGVCGCCPVCARTAGQTCGGDLAYLGKCDRGLTCLPPAPSTGPPLPRFPLQREEPGICTKVQYRPEHHMHSTVSSKDRAKRLLSTVVKANYSPNLFDEKEEGVRCKFGSSLEFHKRQKDSEYNLAEARSPKDNELCGSPCHG
ncbi:hypothetical protein C0Q70_19704 [Pomacea canaliculata]|uniref:IGFBP N-terminal domain-containing protein n=1 Tax=Pomacea canaliculata TaxID=400727 RepID=A0A2T7NDH4_POMCA|nr:hypothetical protein C0Q70_19704 [Pomacea canaliculata]